MIQSVLRYTFLLLMTVCSFQARAQMGMGKVEEIEEVKKRKLIVVIEEPDEKVLKKIAKHPKRGTVEDYKADLKTLNENMKMAVEKFWPYKKNDIQYKTFAEIDALRKTKTKGYAVLGCFSVMPTKFTSSGAGYIFNKGLHWEKDIKQDFEDRNDYDMMFTVLMVDVIEDFGGRIVPVSYVPLYDVFPTKASIVFGIKSIENYFTQRIRIKKEGAKKRDEAKEQEELIAARTPKIAEKTLLIRSEWLDKELTEENFAKYYPYKFKICDHDFMDDVVMNQDANYAYAVLLAEVQSGSTANVVLNRQFVLDAASNETMCIVRRKNSVALAIGKSNGANFTIRSITKLVEQIKGNPEK